MRVAMILLVAVMAGGAASTQPSPYRVAREAATKAEKEYLDARAKLLPALKKNPKYKQAIDKEAAARANWDRARTGTISDAAKAKAKDAYTKATQQREAEEARQMSAADPKYQPLFDRWTSTKAIAASLINSDPIGKAIKAHRLVDGMTLAEANEAIGENGVRTDETNGNEHYVWSKSIQTAGSLVAGESRRGTGVTSTEFDEIEVASATLRDGLITGYQNRGGKTGN